MTIIDRYISREILTLFALLLGLLVTIFVGFSSANQLQQAAAGSLPAAAVPQLILLNTLIALVVLLPTTLFFSCIAALGRLQQDYETLTMLSAGVTPLRIAYTVIKFAAVIAIATAVLSIFLRPWAYERSYQLESEVLSKLDINAIQARQFVALRSSDDVLYAQSIDHDAGQLKKVFLRRQMQASSGSEKPPAPTELVISADSAELQINDSSTSPALLFTDGHAYKLDTAGKKDVALDFGSLRIPLPEGKKMAEYRRNAVDTQTLGRSTKTKDIAEYQWRLVTPLLTLLLAAIAVPLTTAKPWQSRAASIAAALVIYATVFGITSALRTAVEQGHIPTTPGLWLAPVFPALLLLGLTLHSKFKLGN